MTTTTTTVTLTLTTTITMFHHFQFPLVRTQLCLRGLIVGGTATTRQVRVTTTITIEVATSVACEHYANKSQ